jgi:hypothetical protein
MTSGKVGHSIWIPEDLDVMIRHRADSLGLSYNNVIMDALHQFFKMDRDPTSALMQDLRIWLLDEYSMSSFPEDVTLQAFLYIQRTPKLRRRYEQILEAEPGSRTQATLNRRIGQAVRQTLGAKVTVRKVSAPHCLLIKAYSKLKPA